jgi:hypothetical protein
MTQICVISVGGSDSRGDGAEAAIIGSKPHTGATDEQVRRMRASITPLIKRQANISLYAALPSSHTEIPSKNADTIVAAINDLARQTSVSTDQLS